MGSSQGSSMCKLLPLNWRSVLDNPRWLGWELLQTLASPLINLRIDPSTLRDWLMFVPLRDLLIRITGCRLLSTAAQNTPTKSFSKFATSLYLLPRSILGSYPIQVLHLCCFVTLVMPLWPSYLLVWEVLRVVLFGTAGTSSWLKLQYHHFWSNIITFWNWHTMGSFLVRSFLSHMSYWCHLRLNLWLKV